MLAAMDDLYDHVMAMKYGGNLAASVALIVFVTILRTLLGRWVRRGARMQSNDRLRWMAHVRTGMLLVLLLGMLFIWGGELRDFAVSLVALGAAFVLATKELLMCLTGSLFRASSGSFHIGDRIELMGIRGDVIDHTLMGTTLLEIGPNHQRTGRMQTVPNSILLSHPVANESFTQQWVLHTFSVPVAREEWRDAEQELLVAARAACAEYTEAAHKHMDEVGRRHGLAEFSVEPRVTVQISEPHQVRLLVRVPTPAHLRGQTEQRILRGYLTAANGRDAAVVAE